MLAMASIEEALETAGAEDDLQTILQVLETKSVGFTRREAAAGPFAKHGHSRVDWAQHQNAQRHKEGKAAAATSRSVSQRSILLHTVNILYTYQCIPSGRSVSW